MSVDDLIDEDFTVLPRSFGFIQLTFRTRAPFHFPPGPSCSDRNAARAALPHTAPRAVHAADRLGPLDARVGMQHVDALARICELASRQYAQQRDVTPPTSRTQPSLPSLMLDPMLGLTTARTVRHRHRRKGISLSPDEAEDVIGYVDRVRSEPPARESRFRPQHRCSLQPVQLGQQQWAVVRPSLRKRGLDSADGVVTTAAHAKRPGLAGQNTRPPQSNLPTVALGLTNAKPTRHRSRRKGISLSPDQADAFIAYADRFNNTVGEPSSRLQQRRGAVCRPIRFGQRRGAIGGSECGESARALAFQGAGDAEVVAESIFSAPALAKVPTEEERMSASAAWQPRYGRRENEVIDWAAFATRLAVQTVLQAPSVAEGPCPPSAEPQRFDANRGTTSSLTALQQALLAQAASRGAARYCAGAPPDEFPTTAVIPPGIGDRPSRWAWARPWKPACDTRAHAPRPGVPRTNTVPLHRGALEPLAPALKKSLTM